jgi:hypothetical protein
MRDCLKQASDSKGEATRGRRIVVNSSERRGASSGKVAGRDSYRDVVASITVVVR